MSKKKPKKPKLNRRAVFIPFVVIIAIIAASLWWSSRVVSYGQLKTVKNTDGKIQIDVPKQSELAQSSINILDYRDTKNNPDKDVVSHVRVESQYVGSTYISNTKDAILAQLKLKKGSFYESFREKASNSPSADNLYFGDFREFAGNPNELGTDFSYSYPSVDVSGKIMVVFGKDSLYLVIVEATKPVWDNNPDVWDKILSSFKEN